MIIGIDLGGRDVAAVLLRVGGRGSAADLLAAATVARPADTLGVTEVLARLQSEHQQAAQAAAVAVCSDHFARALAMEKNLARTACIRISPDPSVALPAMTGWPPGLRHAVAGDGEHLVVACRGGHRFDGTRAAELDLDALAGAASGFAARGVAAVAITSVFSPVAAEDEVAAARAVGAVAGDLPVTLSHEIGTVGLLMRENATIVNAALLPLADQLADQLAAEVGAIWPATPVFLAQDDGTIADLWAARRFPIRMLSARAACFLRGGALLAGHDAVVVAVDDAVTLVGAVDNGLPRRVRGDVRLAGVAVNLRRSEVVELAYGATTVVRLQRPNPLINEVAATGSDALTVDDLGEVIGGRGDPAGSRRGGMAMARRALTVLADVIDDAVATVDPPKGLPVVAVGRASAELAAALRADRPRWAAAAAAVGAATTQIAGEVDAIVPGGSPASAIAAEQARMVAAQRAVLAGADPESVVVVEADETPLAYLPGEFTHLRVSASGTLAAVTAGRTSPTASG